MVGARTLDIAFAVLNAAPEVPAADHNADLHAHLGTLLNDVANPGNNVKIEAEVLLPRKRLTADLEQNALIL